MNSPQSLKTNYSFYKFNELIQKISQFNVPSINVYQAKDIYKDILVTPEQLLDQQERVKKVPIILLKTAQLPLIQQTGIEAYLEEKEKKELAKLIKQYQQMQEQGEQQINSLESNLDKGIHNILSAENKAGSILFNQAQQRKSFSRQILAKPQLIKALIHASSQAEHELQNKIEEQWAKAIALANEGPSDKIKARTWSIERSAKSRPQLTRTYLLDLYAHADLAYFIEKQG